MAAKDIQLVHSRSATLGRASNFHNSATIDESLDAQETLLAAVVRKQWRTLCVIGAVSVVLAFFFALQFGSIRADSKGAMLYSGLPTPPGPKVYDPPKLRTYSELLLSIPVMQKLCDKHGLDMTPTMLQELFVAKVNRDSNIMFVEFSWDDVDDGIQLVNDAMDTLIDEAAQQRRNLLRDHMKHVEVALLETKMEVAELSDHLRRLQQKRAIEQHDDGLATNRFSSVLNGITATQAAIDAATSDKLGIEAQRSELQASAQYFEQLLRERLVEMRQTTIQDRMDQYKPQTAKWQEYDQVRRELAAYVAVKTAKVPYVEWKIGLDAIGRTLLPSLDTMLTTDVQAWEEERARTQTQRDDLKLQLVRVDKSLELLNQRLNDYEQDRDKLAEDVTGVSADDVNEYVLSVEEATARQASIQHQLENMQQLEQCKTRELSIATPASLESTDIGSNRKKLFVLATLLIGAVLSSPLFMKEWLGVRSSPVQRVASRFGLPVIADRLLSDYSPATRGQQIEWRNNEDLRMLTLRIQQCSHDAASVIVFSGMRSSTDVLPLIGAVAECLAEREERVLLIDAIDPSTVPLSLTHSQFKLLPNGRATNGVASKSKQNASRGLSEYLSNECRDATELISPTDCPGVDWIGSGSGKFPTEAMASSTVTELLNHCRKTYTMLLVAGPPVSSQANLQMLAARADGIVLATDAQSANDTRCYTALQDLIDVGAPVVGVVG